MEVGGEREIIYLPLHCHQQISCCMLCLAGDIRGKGLIVIVSSWGALLCEQKAFNGDVLVNAV